MSLRPTTRALRLTAALLTALLLIGSAVAVSRTRGSAHDWDPGARGSRTREADEGGPARPPSTPGSTPVRGPDLPIDPAAAEALGGEALLAAGRDAAAGDWSVLGHPDWPAEERPVYVATARLDGERRTVDADVT
ncbi:MAG TPA: hypothetical protein VHF25_12935, partial [Nitriliruptorales bacterium]|nr:hypothetical protein [Nitriliruptorales bacterium]